MIFGRNFRQLRIVERMEKECFNCRHYIFFESIACGETIEICCKHKIRIVAEENLACRGWEPDNFHVNNAMDRQIEADDQVIPTTE